MQSKQPQCEAHLSILVRGGRCHPVRPQCTLAAKFRVDGKYFCKMHLAFGRAEYFRAALERVADMVSLPSDQDYDAMLEQEQEHPFIAVTGEAIQALHDGEPEKLTS